MNSCTNFYIALSLCVCEGGIYLTSCYDGVGWGMNRELHCDLLSRLLVIGVCEKQNSEGEWTVCVACDARKQGVSAHF